jgi:hypothetical protein
MTTYFKTEQEIEAVVRGLESCTTPVDDFPHRSHLAVATWYLNRATVPEALDKMRASILRFLDHYGIEGKYNETITKFWLLIVKRCLGGMVSEVGLVERTNAVIAVAGDSRLMFEYYSRERLWSEQAVREWVGPDLKSEVELISGPRVHRQASPTEGEVWPEKS